jgi:histidinol-phosphatase
MSTRKFSLAEDLALAFKIAEAADLITQSRYQSQDLIITTKPDNTPVTDADKATETAIREILMSERPDDGLLGEEFGESENLGSSYWVIDPIDGTKNFMRGVPTWSTLIALIEDGEVIVGVVSAPAITRRWYASKEHGAYVIFNGGAPRKISVSKVSQIKNASVTYSDLVDFDARREAFISLIDQSWRSRGFGDFWSHMLVAEGAADIAVEPVLALWDMAALDIIVREAGGSFTSISGDPGPHHGSGLSTNGLLLDQVVKLLHGTTH